MLNKTLSIQVLKVNALWAFNGNGSSKQMSAAFIIIQRLYIRKNFQWEIKIAKTQRQQSVSLQIDDNRL